MTAASSSSAPRRRVVVAVGRSRRLRPCRRFAPTAKCWPLYVHIYCMHSHFPTCFLFVYVAGVLVNINRLFSERRKVLHILGGAKSLKEVG